MKKTCNPFYGPNLFRNDYNYKRYLCIKIE